MFAMKTSEIAIAANILESRKCPTASVSCRKVAEFDTPLLCETQYDDGNDDDDDNKILCKQEERRKRESRSRHRCCSPVAEFSTRNSVALPGEKTSGNVLVKLTELSRGDAILCVDCEFLLFDELPVTRCLRGYTVSLRGAFVSCIFVTESYLPLSLSRARIARFGGFVCLATRKRESTATVARYAPTHSSLPTTSEVHLAINHAVLLIVLKSCHARVTSLFHVQESRSSSTRRLSLRAPIEIGCTICQSCVWRA